MMKIATAVGPAGTLLTKPVSKAMYHSSGNLLFRGRDATYVLICELDEISAGFETTAMALISGAKDVVNPIARGPEFSDVRDAG
jgi:NAD/NADP transhydrogenase beta subunit